MNFKFKQELNYLITKEQVRLIWLLILIIFGLLILASASVNESAKYFGNEYNFLFKQIIFFSIGFLVMLIVYLIPIKFFEYDLIRIFYIILILGALVAVLNFGVTIKGSTRWLRIFNLNIQVSEIIRIPIFLFITSFISKTKQDKLYSNYYNLMILVIIVSTISILLYLQPNVSELILLITTILSLLYFDGMPIKIRFILATTIILTLILYVIFTFNLSSYINKRIQVFFEPLLDPYGSGYQAIQSLIAINRGGLTGIGYGNGMQKEGLLPEAHNDFIFSILIEEMGSIVAIIFLGLHIFFWHSFLLYAQKIRSSYRFRANILAVMSINIMLSILTNVLVNIKLFPVTGQQFPLLSYGGSSLIYIFICLGMMFRILYETHKTGDTLVVPFK